MKILFSPVGMTDPMTSKDEEHLEYNDGALLHICRHEQPDLVCIYMSEGTIKLDEKDGRYTKSLVLMQTYLREKCGKKMKFICEKHPEVTKPHLFDAFYTDFLTILKKFRKDYPDAEILVNVSSGTPAMKSTLQNLAASSRFLNLKPLQVDSPRGDANYVKKECRDVLDEWKKNVDNQEDSPKRVHVPENKELAFRFNQKLLISLIENYDYHATKTTYETLVKIEPSLEAAISREFKELLDAAILRINLKSDEAVKKIQALGYTGLMDAAPNPVTEYFLLLDIYIKKQSYTDYLRAITPFVLELFYAATEKQCDIKLANYTGTGKNRFSWNCSKLEKLSKLNGFTTINEMFSQRGEYHVHDTPRPCTAFKKDHKTEKYQTVIMLSWHLTNLCENLSSDRRFVGEMIDIRVFEEKIRNLAAHTIRSFTENEIKNETNGISPEEYQKMLYAFLTKHTDFGVTDETRKQYDRINEKLRELLDAPV